MSPRSAATNRTMRDAARARLMEHALRLFGAQGYGATSVGAIARAAGVSHGLLYHYFSGKTDLLRAIFEESLQDVRASWGRADAEPDPRKRLPVLLRAVADIIRERRLFWALSYGVRMQREVLDALGPDVVRWSGEIAGTLERYLREAGWPDPRHEAALLFAQIDGLAQHYVLDPERYPLEALTERLAHRYARPPASRAPRKGGRS